MNVQKLAFQEGVVTNEVARFVSVRGWKRVARENLRACDPLQNSDAGPMAINNMAINGARQTDSPGETRGNFGRW